jgi:hypothetical protein
MRLVTVMQRQHQAGQRRLMMGWNCFHNGGANPQSLGEDQFARLVRAFAGCRHLSSTTPARHNNPLVGRRRPMLIFFFLFSSSVVCKSIDNRDMSWDHRVYLNEASQNQEDRANHHKSRECNEGSLYAEKYQVSTMLSQFIQRRVEWESLQLQVYL